MFGKISGTLVAIATAMVICILGLAVISNMMVNEKLALSNMDPYMVTLLIIAVFVGAQVLLKVVERKLIYSIVVGVIVTGMTVMGGFMMDGEFQNILRNLLAVSAGCTLSAFCFLKGSRKKSRRNIRYR